MIELINLKVANLLHWGQQRFPSRSEILILYGNVVFLIYGWTSIAFFWKARSWSYILSLGEIAVVASYILASDLLESITLLVLLLCLSAVLPASWLRDDFAVRGSILLYCLTFWVGLLSFGTLLELPTSTELLSAAIGFLLTAGLAIWLVNRSPVMQWLIREWGNGLTVFLFLWIPLSLVGLLVMIIRLFGWAN
jgi:hypothetical protein